MPDAIPLVPGNADADVLALFEPLSFWGGVDPTTGTVIDTHHPQHGARFAGRILVLPAGRGSSSSSTVLAETLRLGVGPAAIVLRTPDPILATGALVAEALYGVSMPVVVAAPDTWARCAASHRLRVVATATSATLSPEGGAAD